MGLLNFFTILVFTLLENSDFMTSLCLLYYSLWALLFTWMHTNYIIKVIILYMPKCIILLYYYHNSTCDDETYTPGFSAHRTSYNIIQSMPKISQVVIADHNYQDN